MAERPFSFSVLPSSNGEVVVRVAGEVDVAAEAAFADSLDVAVGQATRRVVVDVSETEFMASTGLNVIVRAARAVTADCTLHVRGARPAIRRVFEITGLESLLED